MLSNEGNEKNSLVIDQSNYMYQYLTSLNHTLAYNKFHFFIIIQCMLHILVTLKEYNDVGSIE